jgi:hypothetical protein
LDSSSITAGSAPVALGSNDYFDEQLPVSLRALSFDVGSSQKIHLWGPLVPGVTPVPVDATITVDGEETVYSRAGGLDSWRVVVASKAGKDTYWFDKKAPNILTKMETHDGRKRSLYGRARWSYWDRRIPRPKILD